VSSHEKAKNYLMRWDLIHGANAAISKPKPRSQAINWFCDDSLWLFSGLETVENDALLSDLWRFDTESRLWSRHHTNEARESAIAPKGRLSAAAWVEETRLCMYGGAVGAQVLDERRARPPA